MKTNKALMLFVAVITAATFSSAALAGEGDAAPADADTQEAQAASAAPAAPAAPADADTQEAQPAPDAGAGQEADVLASVNGQEITRGMIDMVVAQVTAGGTRPLTPEMKKEVLGNLIELELVAQEAEKKGLDKGADFELAMELFRKQQLYTAFLNKEIVETAKLGADEAKTYYDANPDEFKTQEEVKASHILVDALEDAEKIKARIDAGEDFAELAKAESSCPSSTRGGDLGYFTAGRMVPEFENAAFALKVGEVSGPVKTQFGYHIIKVTDKKEAGVKDFEEVRPQIEQKLTFEKQQETYDTLTAKLREGAKIEIFTEPGDEPAETPAGRDEAPAEAAAAPAEAAEAAEAATAPAGGAGGSE